jgi:2-dehydro-3-deoxygluconokinase
LPLQPIRKDAVAANPVLDLVTWGETMVRLSPPVGYPLESSATLEFATGGTESNTAIALSRLGWRVGWTSRLPDNPLGRRIANDIAIHGVDVSRVIWAQDGRAGVMFLESGMLPRPARITYDRAGSAVSRIGPDELDYEYLCSARTLHLTGITPALSAGAREAWLRSAHAAKQAGRRVVLDVNYRSKLWSPEQARATLEAVFPHVDVAISALADVQTIFGLPKDPELAAESFRSAYRLPMVVLTLGADGALAHDGTVARHPVFPTDIVDRIGAGDAFSAGFLFGWEQRDVAWGLRCGCALAALKQTFRGDVTWTGQEELLELVESGAGDSHRVKR